MPEFAQNPASKIGVNRIINKQCRDTVGRDILPPNQCLENMTPHPLLKMETVTPSPPGVGDPSPSTRYHEHTDPASLPCETTKSATHTRPFAV